jgi:hypothetical protein
VVAGEEDDVVGDAGVAQVVEPGAHVAIRDFHRRVVIGDLAAGGDCAAFDGRQVSAASALDSNRATCFDSVA